MRKLRWYQDSIISKARQALIKHRKIIIQLATGGGKTVIMACIAMMYFAKSGKRVLILVHRVELLQQTINTIFRWYDIIAFPILAGKKIQRGHDLFVGMVDTSYNKILQIPAIGMYMIDECHIGNFKKIHEHADHVSAYVIGFSATPIAATVKDPLKNYYEEIVCGIDVPELIKIHEELPEEGLVQNRTYSIKGAVDRKLLRQNSSGEFYEKEMGDEFSKGFNVHNAYLAYMDKGYPRKAIFYNCSIEHSKIVSKYFYLERDFIYCAKEGQLSSPAADDNHSYCLLFRNI